MKMSLPAKMIISVLLLGFFSSSVLSQKLLVTHAPSYVSFQEQEKPLLTSDVPKVISHTLGVPSQKEPSWEGLLHGSLFKRPKANVLVTIITSQGSPGLEIKSQAEFPVSLDSPGVDVNGLMSTIQRNFLDSSPLVLDAGRDRDLFDVRSEFDVFQRLPNTLRRMSDRLLDADSVAQKHTVGTLNTSLNTDLGLIGELQMIQDVISTLESDGEMTKQKSPDMFSFTISSLPEVDKKHGQTSAQSSDAHSLVTDFVNQISVTIASLPEADKKHGQTPVQSSDAHSLVTDFVNQMTGQFKSLYKGNVVVEVLQMAPPTAHSRQVRSLMADDKNETNHRFAMDYDENYPVFFNIILWFMILMAISVYAVGYSIWFMDPGRDSIIYRMTTTRLKKD